MIAILLIVLPIFALILAGWAVGRMRLVGPAGATELNNFVVYLALPALLFDVMVHARWQDIWQPGFIAAYGIGTLLVFTGTTVAAMFARRKLADAAVMGLGTSYANTAFIGFPLTLAIFGPASQPLTLIATILTVIVLFAGSFVLMEVSVQSDRHVGRLLLKVARALAVNPIIIASALGALYHATGWSLSPPVETFLHLLGPVAPPTALVAVGLFIAESKARHAGAAPAVVVMSVVKLAIHPALTWAIGTAIGLPPDVLHVAVLIAALPTGTGPFMLAKLYNRPAAITSDVILTTTIASVATVTVYLWTIGTG